MPLNDQEIMVMRERFNQRFDQWLMACLLLVIGTLTLSAQSDNRGVKPLQGKPDENKDLPLYAESHALLIGVSEYKNGWRNLPGVSEDLVAVQTALAQHGFQVTVVNNPTGVALEQAIKNFVGTHGQAAKNRLLIYFAGHGHTLQTADRRTLGYLVPSDAPLPERGIGAFKQTALSLDTIEVYAKQIESLHALFVFDSCFSGSLFETMRSAPETIRDKLTKPVRMFITAGTADQQVPDKSIFRAEFVRGINGAADLNQDGYVTGSELGVYVEDKVTNYTRKAQTPRWGKIRHPDLDKGDFVFVSEKTRRAPPMSPVIITKLYTEMTAPERRVFVEQQAEKIAAMLGAGASPLPDKAVNAINNWVEAYAKRAASLSEKPGEEGLRAIFGRASQYAPIINKSFKEHGAPPILGIYLPMILSEYRACLGSDTGTNGLFPILPRLARSYGIFPEDRCNILKLAPAVAYYLNDRLAEFGGDSAGMTLVVANFGRNVDEVRRDLDHLGLGISTVKLSYWTMLDNAEKLSQEFRDKYIDYVPKFFAAAIIGENPQVFGLPMQPLSTH